MNMFIYICSRFLCESIICYILCPLLTMNLSSCVLVVVKHFLMTQNQIDKSSFSY